MALPLLLAALAAEGVYRGVKGQREREQAEQLTQMRGEAAGDLIQGAGLPMGPMVDTTPAEQQQLGGIARGMASPFEDVREQAFGQLEGLSPKAQVQQARDEIALNRERLEFAALQNPKLASDPEFAMNAANQLRDERRSDAVPYMQKLANYGELESLLTSGQRTGPAAFASMFKFISSLDDSVVRASETGALMGGSGAARQFVMWYNEALGKGFIDDTMAAEMLSAAQAIAQSQQAGLAEVNRYHDRQAAQYMESFVLPQNFLGLTGGGGVMPGPRSLAPIPETDRTEPPDYSSDEPNIDYDLTQ